MSKRWILVLGLLAVCGLTACRATATPTLEPEATATRAEVVATATRPKESTATLAPMPTAPAVAASRPGATPTPPWQIPVIRESDWTKGADDAGLVIVEYSDYQ